MDHSRGGGRPDTPAGERGCRAPMQYPALALNRPLIDPWLAAGDAALGISVPVAVQWTSQYPALVAVLRWSYISSSAAVRCAGPAVADVQRPFRALGGRLALPSVLGDDGCPALRPAACTFTYQHFTPLLNESRFIEHFATARAGGFRTIDFDHLEGLVSCPSFHVAGAWMVTWAFRRTWLLVPLAILNSALAASTVMLGAHYFVDLIATAVMVGFSAVLFNLVGRRLLPSRQG